MQSGMPALGRRAAHFSSRSGCLWRRSASASEMPTGRLTMLGVLLAGGDAFALWLACLLRRASEAAQVKGAGR
ncbi:MAG: hypothetical protein JWN04_5017 [Myxococcaceae bacterium]|nr:hypothetical protein [Myxococcaceae bacterium]